MTRRALSSRAVLPVCVAAALLDASATLVRADEPVLDQSSTGSSSTGPSSTVEPSAGQPGFGADVRAPQLDSSWRRTSVVDAHGFHIERHAQWIDGVRVDGADAVVRTRRDGVVDLLRTTTPVGSSVRAPRVAWDEAEPRAIEPARMALVGFDVVRVTDVERVWARPEGEPHAPVEAALRLRVEGASPVDRASVLVAADDARVLRIDLLALDARGSIFARNPRSDMDATVEVELPTQSDPDTLTSEHFTVRSCIVGGDGSCTPIARATPDVDGNFLLMPFPNSFEDGFAEVMAFHHVSALGDALERDHGFRWTCARDDSMRLFTNFTDAPGRAYANAAFVPGSRSECGYLLFGQSGAMDFAYDADVVYHELGHAVTQQLANIVGFAVDSLGMGYEPLAINEGTSDYWAATTQGDPHVGESLEGLDGVGRSAALRDLDGALRCPNDLVGEGHFDGRIWAGVFWDLRTELGAEKVDALMYTTMASMGTAPGLDDAAELAVSTADSLATMGTLTTLEAARVHELFEERGLIACRRVTPLDDGETRAGFSGVASLTAGLGQSVAPVHYSITLPPDATSVSIAVTGRTFVGRYNVLARRGRPIGFAGGRLQIDQRFEVGRMGTATIDASSAAFAPCTTLYLAIETTDLRTGESLFTVSGDVAVSGDPAARCPDPEPDAGPIPDASVSPDAFDAPDAGPPAMSGGCGCRASGPARPLAWTTLLGAAVLLARLRRRARR